MFRRDQKRRIFREVRLWTRAAAEAVRRLEVCRERHRAAFSDRSNIAAIGVILASMADEMRVDETAVSVLLNRSLSWLSAAHQDGHTNPAHTPLAVEMIPRLKDLRNMHEHSVEYQLRGTGRKQGQYVTTTSSSGASVSQGADGCSYLNGELFLSNRIALIELRAVIEELEVLIQNESREAGKSI